MKNVLANITSACEVLGPENVKVNVVVMRGFNDDELSSFVRLTRDTKMNLRFIEWMPFSDNGWSQDRFFSYTEMLESIEGDGVKLRGIGSSDVSDTTKWWRGRDGGGEYKGR